MIHVKIGGRIYQGCMEVPGWPASMMEWPRGHDWVSVLSYKQVTCETCKQADEVRARLFVDEAVKKLRLGATKKELLHEVMQNLARGSLSPKLVDDVLRERGYR